VLLSWAVLRLRNVLTMFPLRIFTKKSSMSTQSVRQSTKGFSLTSVATASEPTLASKACQKRGVIIAPENSPNGLTRHSETDKSSTRGSDSERDESRLYSVSTSITPEIWQALSEIRDITPKQFGGTTQNEWRSYNVTLGVQQPSSASVNSSPKDTMTQRLRALYGLVLPKVLFFFRNA